MLRNCKISEEKLENHLGIDFDRTSENDKEEKRI